MDQGADNYNEDATLDDGSCEYGVVGCTDPASPSYSPTATINSAGMCDSYLNDCLATNALNYNPLATQNGYCLDSDGVTVVTCGPNATSFIYSETYECIWETWTDTTPDDPVIIYGCTDPDAINYNEDATVNWVSATDQSNPCVSPVPISDVEGCTDEFACNYNPFANTEDGSCDYLDCVGCTEYGAFNFCPTCIISCIDCCCWNFEECTNTPDEGTFDSEIESPDPTDQSNYCPEGQIWVGPADTGGCEDIVYGCMDEAFDNYNPLANVDDASCEGVQDAVEIVFGCTDPAAFNYDPLATSDNGSCIAIVDGCSDVTMFYFDPDANTDDGSCNEIITGCMDDSVDEFGNFIYSNYNPNANMQGTVICTPYVYGCTDSNALNYDEFATVNQVNSSDTASPCVYPSGADAEDFEINVQNYPEDSDSQDQQ